MAQNLFPDSDISVGAGWSAPVWFNLVADDNTFEVQSSGNENVPVEVGLIDGTDPGVSTGHVINVRWRKSGNRTLNAFCTLVQGVNSIATLSVSNLGTSEGLSQLALSGAQADSITDYTDLRLRIQYTYTGGGSPSSLEVDQAFLEIPDAGPTTREGTASITVAVTTAATGLRTAVGTAAIGVSSTIAATGLRTAKGTASNNVTVSIAATGSKQTATKEGTASISLATTIAATGLATRKRTASSGISVSIAADGVPTRKGTASIAPTVTVAADGVATRKGTAAIVSAVALAAEGLRTAIGNAASSLSISITASGAKEGIKTGTASITIPVTINATGLATRKREASVGLSISIAAEGEYVGEQSDPPAQGEGPKASKNIKSNIIGLPLHRVPPGSILRDTVDNIRQHRRKRIF